MERLTVDFGIDLGTTNSCIAVLDGTTSRIIKTNERTEYTPSVVSFDKKGRLRVGQTAKNQQISPDETEWADVCQEFKLRMGHSGSIHTFQVNNKEMTPEELSAEILKALKEDVQRELNGENISASVISVPAAFENPQCSATDKAAKLAGLSFSPLIQEPVAAALAYGFQTKSDRVFWMVYDFGGGTFDAAIMQVRDEQIQVVNHGGDNHLGGKLIDWDIVNHILLPAVTKEFNLSPNDKVWEAVSRRLKYEAELAKISLSAYKETDLIIRQLFIDDKGKSIPFEYELTRSDIERYAEPYIERSINKCKTVLEEARLSSSDIEKLILVGGPTLSPLFREMLTSKLGIALEFREDPLTVVARGAAIFAGTQRIPENSKASIPISTGQFRLEIDYQPIGDQTEPTVGGRVIANEGQSLQGYTIEFVESKTAWRSGKVEIGLNGSFISAIHAERERRNEYLIELRDSKGNLYKTVPDRFNYTVGITISAQPIVNNIGIALADNQVLPFFKKNTPLPAKRRETGIRTTASVKRGDSGTLFRVPVVEGNNPRADRNHLVGYLEVHGTDIHKDFPIDSEIEVTLSMDESRIIRIYAYVPYLDQEFEGEFDAKYPELEEWEVTDEVEKAKKRLEEIRNKIQSIESPDAGDILKQVDEEHIIDEIDPDRELVQQNNGESIDRRHRRRIELDVKLDEIEELISWPAMVAEAEAEISGGREIIENYGDSQDNNDFSRLEGDVKKAIASKNRDSLQQKTRSLSQLVMQVLMKQPGFWVAQLERLEEEYKENMRDQTEAKLYFAQGYQAINNQDVEGLKMAVRQLYGLLPESMAEEIQGYRSTVIKHGF